MRVRFQYVDWTEWEGPPGDAARSPDKGVIRMWAVTDTGRELEFVYDDFYFVYWDAALDGWRFGSGTPKREFVLRVGRDGSETIEIAVQIPPQAVVRRGETVSDDEALRFGLKGGRTARPKRQTVIDQGGGGS